jgi:hypothetical protein
MAAVFLLSASQTDRVSPQQWSTNWDSIIPLFGGLEAGLYVSERVDGETVANLRKLDLPYNDVLRVVRQRKANLVRRHIRIAEQYAANVVKGMFPLRINR